ncbi:gluconate kinase [Geovibrio thiophilus]|uniref:Gluconate kinase n=1 Tax=Geovibrio thiophilus TaxID=139438 RepID=A0A3R5XXK7_9BACT|nr:AAA family ATPase [Geovibrio thiophilus]QAR33234.1 gluconate kinase [Geovibrio thiophilus]
MEAPIVMIMKDLLKPEKVVETHISYVFLTADKVYKVKKNVNFGFLDFSRLKLRKQYCLLEKELNGRFCEGIYGEVLKVARKEKSFEITEYENTQNTLEYVVTMKRIPEDCFLSYKVKEGLITVDDMRKTGRHIADLFSSINTDEASAEENGGASVVRFNCGENFSQTESFAGRFIDKLFYDFIKKETLAFLDKHSDIFASRVKSGFVVNGHGDLRAEHVFFERDKVGLIDCIEFNKRFRYNDVVSEAAFICMELDELGRTDLSDALAEGFFEKYNDENSIKLFNFYKCYRAFVRAKVTCFLLAQKGEEWEGFAGAKKSVDRLIDLAAAYALNMEQAKTLMFYGYMGCGKSKNAKVFSEKFAAANYNTDVERKLLCGLQPTDSRKIEMETGIYIREKSLEVYAHLGRKAAEKAKTGRMTVLDGTFSDPAFVKAAEESTDFDKKILFTADDSVILERFKERAKKTAVTDGREEIYFQHKDKFVDAGADLSVETTGCIEDNARRIMEFLINEE